MVYLALTNPEGGIEMVKVKDYLASLTQDAVDEKMKAFAKDQITTVTETQASKDRTLASKFYSAIASNDPFEKREVNKAVEADYATKGQSVGTPGTGTAGGVLVPTTVADNIIEQVLYVSPMRKISDVIANMPAQLNMPSETTPVQGYWIAEGSPVTASSEVFAPNVLTPYELAGLDTFTNQILMDAATVPDLQTRVERRFATALALTENAAFANGTGSGQPWGFRSSQISPTAVAQAGATLAYTDITKLYYTIGTGYRPLAVWVTSSAGMQALSNLRDSQGRPILLNSFDGVAQGMPAEPTLLGRPVYVVDEIPANLGTGTNATEIWFGVFKDNYIIGDRQGLTVDYGTNGTDFANNALSLRVIRRVAGMPINSNAFVKMTGVLSS